MKLLREYIRELLTESIDPRIMKQIDKAEEMGCKVVIVDTGGYGIAEIVQGAPPHPPRPPMAKFIHTYHA